MMEQGLKKEQYVSEVQLFSVLQILTL